MTESALAIVEEMNREPNRDCVLDQDNLREHDLTFEDIQKASGRSFETYPEIRLDHSTHRAFRAVKAVFYSKENA